MLDTTILNTATNIPLLEQVLLAAILLAGALLPSNPKNNALQRIYAVVSSVVLILLWHRNFLFSANVGIFDSTKESFYLNFLESSLKELREIPLTFLKFPPELLRFPIPATTVSYWANPEVLSFSPLLPLLFFMEAVTFFKVSFFLYLAIGAYGCFRLGRRLQLPVVGGALLFLTIILNPWLLQHLAIGYSPWLTFCLLPLLTDLLADPRIQSRKLAAAAGLNCLLVYGGALHLFFWYNGAAAVFVLLLALRKHDWQAPARFYLYLLLSSLLILPKIIAVLSALQGFRRVPQASYSSLADLWELFTDKTSPLYDLPTSYSTHGVNFYDGSVYTGHWFIVLVAGSIILAGWRWRKRQTEPLPPIETLLVAILFLFLGFNGIWPLLAKAIPFLDTEVYPWRFLFVTLFLLCTLVVCAVFSLSRSLFSRERVALVVAVLLLLPVALSFQQRNQYFARVATTNPDQYASLSIRKAIASLATRPTADSSPNRMQYLPDPQGAVRVEWLAPARLHDFALTNVQSAISDGDAVLLLPSDPQQSMVIRPLSFGLWFLLAICLPVFFLVLWLIGRCSPAETATCRFRS